MLSTKKTEGSSCVTFHKNKRLPLLVSYVQASCTKGWEMGSKRSECLDKGAVHETLNVFKHRQFCFNFSAQHRPRFTTTHKGIKAQNNSIHEFMK